MTHVNRAFRPRCSGASCEAGGGPHARVQTLRGSGVAVTKQPLFSTVISATKHAASSGKEGDLKVCSKGPIPSSRAGPSRPQPVEVTGNRFPRLMSPSHKKVRAQSDCDWARLIFNQGGGSGTQRVLQSSGERRRMARQRLEPQRPSVFRIHARQSLVSHMARLGNSMARQSALRQRNSSPRKTERQSGMSQRAADPSIKARQLSRESKTGLVTLTLVNSESLRAPQDESTTAQAKVTKIHLQFEPLMTNLPVLEAPPADILGCKTSKTRVTQNWGPWQALLSKIINV